MHNVKLIIDTKDIKILFQTQLASLTQHDCHLLLSLSQIHLIYTDSGLGVPSTNNLGSLTHRTSDGKIHSTIELLTSLSGSGIARPCYVHTNSLVRTVRMLWKSVQFVYELLLCAVEYEIQQQYQSSKHTKVHFYQKQQTAWLANCSY